MDFLLLLVVMPGVAGYGLMRWVRHIRKKRYFASAGFLAHKREIAAFVAEHNDVAR